MSKCGLQDEQKLVKEISKGGFFGEVALVTKSATRAATCIAKTRCLLHTPLHANKPTIVHMQMWSSLKRSRLTHELKLELSLRELASKLSFDSQEP